MGGISAQRGGTGGASKALSNLANVAINAALMPKTGTVLDLGGALFVDPATSRVGVGTATPGADFEVAGKVNIFPKGSGTVQIVDMLAASASYVQFRIGKSAVRSAAAVWQEAEGRFAFNTSSLDFPIIFNNGALFVDRLATGRVGIGTVTPGAQLEVSRASSDQQILLRRTGSLAGAGYIYSNVNELFGINDGGATYPFLVKRNSPDSSVVIEANGSTRFRGSLIPTTDKLQDFGTATKRWRSIHLTKGSIFFEDTELSVDSDGALVFTGAGGVKTPSALPEWLDLNRASATGNQSGIKTGTDIIMDSSRGNGLAYNATTGVVTLKANKTYRLFASFAFFSIESGDTVAVEWVEASDNTPLVAGHETRLRPANAPSNGSNAPTIEVIYKPTVDTDVKLRCTEYTHSTDSVAMYWERSMATVVEL